MKKTIILILTLIQGVLNFAQTDKQYLIKSTVVEKETGIALSYANVFNQRLLTGTATNIDGYFELPNNRIGDTIIISYLGYIEKTLIVKEKMQKKISLTPNSALLGEVVVTANDDYLYDLIAKVRKNKKTKTRTSKTYFYLETLLFDKPIEIIESYYNGAYSNFGTEELKIKKGRIGLKPVNNRYFSSTESSRLFSLHNLFFKSDFFPDNPLLLKKRKLRKKYLLSLNHTYSDNQSKIYVVDFKPKNDNPDLFHGTVWVDQNKNRIIKISLNIQNSKKHPFIPLGYNTIGHVDMEVTKTYKEIEGELFINTIDYNYKVVYSDQDDNKFEATSRAFSKAYNYNEKFNLPFFDFSKGLHEDYRNITITPYDFAFWKGSSEFRFYDRLQKVEDFILKNRIENNIIFPLRNSSPAQRLKSAYVIWDRNRIKINQVPYSKLIENQVPDSRSTKDILANRYPSTIFDEDRYKIDVKIYLDVNIINDSLTFQLETVLDPIRTFYHFEIKNNDLAFINMYFDLMEIQKRKLKTQLLEMSNPSYENVFDLYQKNMEEFNNTIQTFIAEVNRGKNLEGVKIWSDYIFKFVNIDNLKLFGLQELDD